MSNTPSNGNNLNDDDISALFAADEQQPPAELDAQILGYAKSAQIETIKHKRETFFQRYTPLLSTAAVVALAVTITPLLMKAPQLDQGQIAASDDNAAYAVFEKSTADSSDETQEAANVASARSRAIAKKQNAEPDRTSTKMANTEVATLTDSSTSVSNSAEADIQVSQTLGFGASVSSPATLTVKPEASSLSSAAPLTESIADVDTSSQMAGIAANKTSEINKSPLYRLNPKRWINEINRLFKENKLVQATQELKLFREKHPDHPNEDLLPTALREANTKDEN